MSFRRLFGIMLRYIYTFNRSLDRWVDALYWPALDIVIWGLTISAFKFFSNSNSFQVHLILAGLIFWYVLWRGQYEITLNVLEELWSENLVSFFGSPIKVIEWIVALFSLGILKLFITFSFMTALCYFLYDFNIFIFKGSLILFAISLLITGWSFGLFVGGIFLRFGTKLQSLAWAGAFFLMPFSATFYPLTVLPNWAQKISICLPSSYIFEAMRAYLTEGTIRHDLLLKSYLLNIVYITVTLLFFMRSFKKAKEKGISHLK